MLPAPGWRMLADLFKAMVRRRRAEPDPGKRAIEHYERGELDAAAHHFRLALKAEPGEARHWIHLAATLMRQQNHAAAMPVLLEVVEMCPDLAEAHNDLGLCRSRLRDTAAAAACFKTALALKPDYAAAQSNLINAYMDACDWAAVAAWRETWLAARAGDPEGNWVEWLAPFTALMLLPMDIARQVSIRHAERIAAAIHPASVRRDAVVSTASGHSAPSGHPTASGPPDKRPIRVGYVSGDFYAHAVMHLSFGLFASHDRDKVEVFAYSIGRADDGPYRKQVRETSDHFADVRHLGSAAIAQMIANDRIDILVDMTGYTANARPDIFAYRAAPVQVNYLGYPGTSGAPWMDYFITDPIATPPGMEGEFTEALAYLPHSYQINDNRQPISPDPMQRADFALPDGAFVFCCFNALRKIDPLLFGMWMNILRQAPGSVLWLLDEDAAAVRNLRGQAEQRRIDPARLVFAGKLDKPLHLARHRLADLFLDTLNYNAHTTGSDALWAGLPMLSCPGTSFAGRVGASLLHAVGLPELVVADLVQYEALALQFARDPAALRSLRARLAQNRLTCPLFDTPRYVRHLEAAYLTMHAAARRGSPPESFHVPPG